MIFKKGSAPIALKRVRFDLDTDCHICIRELSSTELIAYQQTMGEKDTSNMDFVFNLIAKCACDDSGQPLFDNADDVKNNFNVGLSVLIDVQKRIMDLSGLTPKN